ncbi:MAG TPA: hypothetical protein VHF28_03630 [Nitrososphaera sp.]|nr:hypothetical protein [Nitrososphaera sp.]
MITILLPTITTDFLIFATPNALGQQVMSDSIDKGSGRSVWGTTSDYNSTDYNIIPVSTSSNDSIAMSLANMNQTIPQLSIADVINSTYIVPKEVNENESERRISRAIRDRINDILHTIVMNNATITNSFVNGSTTINNHTRLLEVIPDQVEVALTVTRTISEPTNSVLVLHTEIDAECSANNTTLSECNMNIKIR